MADYSAIIQADGPIAYWRMGEASGLPQDSTGRGCHATSAVGVLTYSVAGALTGDANTAIEAATGARFDMPDNANFAALGDGPWTIEFWAKRPAGDFTSTKWMFGCWDGDASVAWTVGTGYGTGRLQGYTDAGYFYTSSETPVIDGNWHHIVFTKNGAERTGFCDGVMLTNTATNYPVGNPTANGWSLSAAGNSTSNSFVGTLDEVALYKKVLSPAQVAAHYAAGITAASGRSGLTASSPRLTVYPDYSAVIQADGPVVYWRMNEASGQLIDSTGRGHNSSAASGITYGAATPLVNDPYAKSMYGSESVGYADVPYHSDFDFGDGPLTVEYWVKREATGTIDFCIGNQDFAGPPGGGFSMGWSGAGELWAYRGVNVYASTTTPGNDTNWHHVVWTKNGSAQAGYCDGVLLGNTQASTLTPSTHALGILTISGATTTNKIGGWMAEVALYRRVLSPAVVAAHYAAGITAGIGSLDRGVALIRHGVV